MSAIPARFEAHAIKMIMALTSEGLYKRVLVLCTGQKHIDYVANELMEEYHLFRLGMDEVLPKMDRTRNQITDIDMLVKFYTASETTEKSLRGQEWDLAVLLNSTTPIILRSTINMGLHLGPLPMIIEEKK